MQALKALKVCWVDTHNSDKGKYELGLQHSFASALFIISPALFDLCI